MRRSDLNLSESSSGGAGLPRNVWAVTITSFLTDVSSEMLFNLLPLFLFNVLGVRTSLIGVIEGVAETTASLLKGFSGWLSDRLGRRKGLAVLGYALSTVAKPFLYLASNWVWVLGVRFADRLGKGVRTAPRDALVADSIDAGRRGLAFGLHRAGDTAGAFVGIAIALWIVLMDKEGSSALTRSTFDQIVLISLIPAALAVLVLAIGAREVHATARQMGEMAAAGGMPLDRRFRVFLVIMVIFTLGNSSDAFLILRAENVGLSTAGILGMMMLFNLIYAGLSSPAGALSDRLGRKRLLLGGWLVYGLVYAGFAGMTRSWQAVGLMAGYGVYYALAEGVGRAFVADLVLPPQRGLAYGAYHAAVGVAALPASLLAGVLWQGVGSWPGFGPQAPFIAGAALALAAGVLLMKLEEPARQEQVNG
jgi:MFS family permease